SRKGGARVGGVALFESEVGELVGGFGGESPARSSATPQRIGFADATDVFDDLVLFTLGELVPPVAEYVAEIGVDAVADEVLLSAALDAERDAPGGESEGLLRFCE